MNEYNDYTDYTIDEQVFFHIRELFENAFYDVERYIRPNEIAKDVIGYNPDWYDKNFDSRSHDYPTRYLYIDSLLDDIANYYTDKLCANYDEFAD